MINLYGHPRRLYSKTFIKYASSFPCFRSRVFWFDACLSWWRYEFTNKFLRFANVSSLVLLRSLKGPSAPSPPYWLGEWLVTHLFNIGLQLAPLSRRNLKECLTVISALLSNKKTCPSSTSFWQLPTGKPPSDRPVANLKWQTGFRLELRLNPRKNMTGMICEGAQIISLGKCT